MWDAKATDHPLVHTFANAHPLGAHHVVVDINNTGTSAASSGFGQELVLWDLEAGKEKIRLNPRGNNCSLNIPLTRDPDKEEELDGKSYV